MDKIDSPGAERFIEGRIVAVNHGTRTPAGRPLEEMRGDAGGRRGIARELQESTSQPLVRLRQQLGRLRKLNAPGVHSLIDQCDQAVAEITEEIRALGTR